VAEEVQGVPLTRQNRLNLVGHNTTQEEETLAFLYLVHHFGLPEDNGTTGEGTPGNNGIVPPGQVLPIDVGVAAGLIGPHSLVDSHSVPRPSHTVEAIREMLVDGGKLEVHGRVEHPQGVGKGAEERLVDVQPGLRVREVGAILAALHDLWTVVCPEGIVAMVEYPAPIWKDPVGG